MSEKGEFGIPSTCGKASTEASFPVLKPTLFDFETGGPADESARGEDKGELYNYINKL